MCICIYTDAHINIHTHIILPMCTHTHTNITRPQRSQALTLERAKNCFPPNATKHPRCDTPIQGSESLKPSIFETCFSHAASNRISSQKAQVLIHPKPVHLRRSSVVSTTTEFLSSFEVNIELRDYSEMFSFELAAPGVEHDLLLGRLRPLRSKLCRSSLNRLS